MRETIQSGSAQQNINALKTPAGDHSQLSLITAFESLKSQLGRAPTLKELSFELSKQDPACNIDRVRRTLAQINESSSNAARLKTTPGRPDVLYQGLVKEVYLQYLADHAEPPTRDQLRQALEARSCFIPHATALSILKRARDAAEPADYQWRLIKSSSLIPARDLVEAYREAKKRLTLIGDTRNPTKYQISCVLNESGISATAELVKRRLETLNANRSEKLETHPVHFSTASRLMEYCYRHFEEMNKRPPSIVELRTAINRLAFHKLDQSSILQLLSKVRHTTDSALKVERRRPLSVSNQELQATYRILQERMGRIPVITEVQEYLIEQYPDKRVNGAHIRKLLQNVLHLEFYDSVAEALRHTLRECIPALHKRFGMAPSAYDVQEHLLKSGFDVSRKYISEILLQLRASGEDLQLRRGSGFGRTYRDRLEIAYRAFLNTHQQYPNSVQLAESTGMSADAVTQLAQKINKNTDPSKGPPLIIVNTSNEVLSALRILGKKDLSTHQRIAIEQLNLELASLDSILPALSFTSNNQEYIRSIELAQAANLKIATDSGEAIYRAEIIHLSMQKRFLTQDKTPHELRLRLFALYACFQAFSEDSGEIKRLVESSSTFADACAKINTLFDSYCRRLGLYFKDERVG